MGRRLAPNPEHLAFGDIFFSRLSRKGNELSFSCYGISWERVPSSIGLCSRGGFEGCGRMNGDYSRSDLILAGLRFFGKRFVVATSCDVRMALLFLPRVRQV